VVARDRLRSVLALPAALVLAQSPSPSPSGTPVIQDVDLNRLAEAFRAFWERFVDKVPNIVAALVFLAMMVVFARLIRQAVERGLRRTSTEAHVHLLVAKLAYFASIVIGLVVGLAILGVNLAVLMGSLGLASVALGFALQDILGNFVAGIVLLLEHPFTRGDYIITESAQGTVEDIRVRATLLRTPDGQLVLVPNKLLFTDVLTNASATDRRRIQVAVTVPYQEDTARTRSLLLDTVGSVEEVADEPPPQLFTQDLGQGGLQLVMWFWVDPAAADMLLVRSEVLDRLERALRAADIDLVAPTLMATVPSDEAEGYGAGQAVTVRGEPVPERVEPATGGGGARPAADRAADRKEPRA
jgi:small conductance mechanosensitive channel